MSGFELDTDEVGSVARTLHATPGAPVCMSVGPTSYFDDLTTAGRELATRWGTGVSVMGTDVVRLADSLEQTVLGYLASDQQAARAFGP